MNRAQAITTLEQMVETVGVLRLITNECTSGACNPSGHDVKAFPLTDPRHFVVRNIVSLEGPNSKGQFKAYTAEKDWCQGQPDALLARLLEAGGAGSMAEIPAPKKRGFWARLFRQGNG